MKHLPTLDFETKSRQDIRKVGAYRYAMDPSTDVLCLVYDLQDGKGKRLWFPGRPVPTDLANFIRNGGVFEAHNAEFEYCIFNFVLAARYGFPRVEIRQLRCSAAKAAALALPRSLEGLGVALNTSIPKDMEGRRLMLKMSKPRKPTKKDPREWHDSPEDRKRLYKYCRTDVLAEEACSILIPDLPQRSLDLFHFTIRMNERGVHCDVDLCKKALVIADLYEKELLSELRTLTDNQVHTAKQTAKLLKVLAQEGCELPNVQAKTVRDTLKKKKLNDKAKRILQIRQSLAMSSLSKYKSMLAVACADQRLRGMLVWHGASTGRYAGRLVQPQNFARGNVKDVKNIHAALADGDYKWFSTLFPDVFAALSAGLRGMLRAAPGHDLLAADFSAIEVRVLFWLAGCESGLKIYRDGGDIYVEMAADVYGVPKNKIVRIKANGEVEVIDKPKRQMGKQIILGCGFGMGGPTFVKTCAQYDMEVTEAFAKKAVFTYRDKFPEIPAFWKRIEAACIHAVKTGRSAKCGFLTMFVEGDFLYIRLPSGRNLAYKNPKITMAETSWGEMKPTLSFMAVHPKTKQWVREKTYGGKLTENVVQATAADLMMEAMVRVENAGYPVILTVHDEIVSEVKKGFGSLKEFERLMSTLPAWAKGLPVAVEGWREERFKK